MLVSVDDEQREIPSVFKGSIDLVKHQIIEDLNPNMDCEGLIILTEEEYEHWVEYSQTLKETIKENNPTSIPEKKDKTITPTLQSPQKEVVSKGGYSSEVTKVLNKISNMKEKEREALEKKAALVAKDNFPQFNTKKKNKKDTQNKDADQNGFGESQEPPKKLSVADLYEDKKEENIVPILKPPAPELPSKISTGTDQCDNLKRNLIPMEEETKKIIKTDPLEELSNKYKISLKSDYIADDTTKKLPAILLPEQLKVDIMKEAKDKYMTLSQYVAYLYFKEIIRKMKGED